MASLALVGACFCLGLTVTAQTGDLPGGWRTEGRVEAGGEGFSFSQQSFYASNGKFAAVRTTLAGRSGRLPAGLPQDVVWFGSWQVTDGELVLTVVSSSDTRFLVAGAQARLRILEVTGNEARFVGQTGIQSDRRVAWDLDTEIRKVAEQIRFAREQERYYQGEAGRRYEGEVYNPSFSQGATRNQNRAAAYESKLEWLRRAKAFIGE